MDRRTVTPLGTVAAMLALVACWSVPAVEQIPPASSPEGTPRYYEQGELDLDDLRAARSITRQSGTAAVNEIRAEALKETALMYGTRAGLYARMLAINRMLDRHARRYDQVFPFGPLMLANNILPPVMQSGLDSAGLFTAKRVRHRISGG